MKNTKIVVILLAVVIILSIFLFPKTKVNPVAQIPSTTQTGFVLGSWSQSGILPVGVLNHGIAKLSNGKILLAGGRDDAGMRTKASQIFDTISSTWSTVSPLRKARENHTLSLIVSGPNTGKILAVGGLTGTNNLTATNTTELYNPVTNQWVNGPTMAASRYGHRAVSLSDGRIVIVGGHEPLRNGGVGNTAQIYNPATNSFTSMASPSVRRNEFAAVYLPASDGFSNPIGEKIVVIGGGVCSNPSIEIYDVTTNTWTNGPALLTNRSTHEAVLLENGKILIVGGISCLNSSFVSDAELYDPIAGTVVPVGSTEFGQRNPQIIKLLSGEVLSLGGLSTVPPSPYSGAGTNVAFEFDPMMNTWTTINPMQHYYGYHRAILLNDGRVLVTGGTGGQHNKSEIFNPQ